MRKRALWLIPALALLWGLTACGKPVPAGDSVASTPDNTPAAETPASAPTATPEPTPELSPEEARRAAYRAALEGVYFDYILPDGMPLQFELYNYLGEEISENEFAVYDVDGDGRDELLLVYTTTITAGVKEFIYDFDGSTGAIREEFLDFPKFTYYDNGMLKSEWSHNQTDSDFWPYWLYQYDPETDSYVVYAGVSAWDQERLPSNYPAEVDVSGTGTVYYVMPAEYWKDDLSYYASPVDVTEYEAWLDSCLGDAEPLEITYWNLTEENISLILG